MIPCVGIAYISHPGLMASTLASIDRDVKSLVVVDNSPDASAPVSDGIVHIAMRHNIGVSAAWNLVFKARPLASWWLILNSDLILGPGDLAALEEVIDPGRAMVVRVDDFAAFGITAKAVARVGLFDENFVPAYYEDNDYAYRCRLMGVPVEDSRFTGFHAGSAVLRGSEGYRRENNRTFPSNGDYYRRKWGGMPRQETYTTPFDRGGSPAQWDYDHARLAELTWR